MPRTINRRNVIKGLGLTTAAGLAGCISDDPGSGDDGGDGSDPDQDRTVMVGVLQPTTGDLGSVGVPIRDAGLLPGIQLEGADLPFEFDIRDEDTQTDLEAALSAAQALVDAGYPSINGAASSGNSIPVYQQILIPNQVVGCSPASTAPAITHLDDDGFVFRTCPSDALQGQVMAEVAVSDLDFDTAATFFLNNDYGQQLSDSFVSAFEDNGGSVSAETPFEPEQPSYTSVLEETLADDPEVLVVIGYPDSGEQIFRDYYSSFEGEHTILVTDGLREPALPGNVDNAMENVIGTAPLAAGPERDFFVDLFEEEFDEEPGVFTAQAYDSTAVQILANVAAGENDGAAIRDQMAAVANPEGEVVGPSNLAEGVEIAANGDEIQYQGASSDINFDDNGDVVSVTYEIFEFGSDGISTLREVNFEG